MTWRPVLWPLALALAAVWAYLWGSAVAALLEQWSGILS